MYAGAWKCSPISSPTWAPPPNFPWFFCYFLDVLQLNKHTFPYLEMCPGPWKCFPTSSPTVRNTPTRHCQLNILVFGLFICICLHILSFQNNPTNKVYILQRKTMSFGPELAELHRNHYFSQNRHVEYFGIRTIYLYLSTYIVMSE